MKAILTSIQSPHACNILNLIKLWEIRKKFPKDYVGWVYIYCTKNSFLFQTRNGKWVSEGDHFYESCNPIHYEGKVVARFWCDKVEEIKFINPNRTCGFSCEISDDDCYYNINEKECCLSQDDLYDYLQGENGKAIHITNLEIFDKPKDISEFYGAFTQKRYERIFGNNVVELDKKYGGLRQPTKSGYEYKYPLTRAPQSWCWIEV